MCTVSFVGDHWRDTYPVPTWVPQPYINPIIDNSPPPTREEFEALKNEMEALKKLLQAAKEYDTATGQPDCEVEDKVELIKRLADLVGVDMSDVFGGDKEDPHPTLEPRNIFEEAYQGRSSCLVIAEDE